MDNALNDKWRLICPPNSWREPIAIDQAGLELLSTIASRLNLVITRDDKRKKVYLGNALASEAEVASGLRYPNGWTADVVPLEEAGDEYKAVDPLAAAPLIRAFPDAQLSKNFRLSEFRPGKHSYQYIRISPALVRVLEDIRERTGRRRLLPQVGVHPHRPQRLRSPLVWLLRRQP